MRNQQEEPTRGTNGRAQENQLKLIQARKTLKARDRVLMAAIRRCHTELAKRISFRDIEASKDAVEAAWDEFTHANSRYCVCAGWNPFRGKEEDQPEEARRVLYVWKALLNMMEQVVEKAEEYLESATKENSCGKNNDDGGDGGELDADEARRVIEAWIEQLSTMSKVNEMALEVSVVNEVNKENEVNVNKVDVNKVDVNKVDVNKVNEDSGEVCDAKEEMSKGKSLEIEAKVEVSDVFGAVKSSCVVKGKPPELLRRFDFSAKVQVEEFSMKMVKISEEDKKIERLLPSKEVKESCHANWDPGELFDAKAQMEMFNVKVEVMPRGNVNTKMFLDAMSFFNFVRLYTSEVLVLVARNAARFVDVNPLSSRYYAVSFLPILSDYG